MHNSSASCMDQKTSLNIDALTTLIKAWTFSPTSSVDMKCPRCDGNVRWTTHQTREIDSSPYSIVRCLECNFRIRIEQWNVETQRNPATSCDVLWCLVMSCDVWHLHVFLVINVLFVCHPKTPFSVISRDVMWRVLWDLLNSQRSKQWLCRKGSCELIGGWCGRIDECKG